jgi:hypothetical protein
VGVRQALHAPANRLAIHEMAGSNERVLERKDERSHACSLNVLERGRVLRHVFGAQAAVRLIGASMTPPIDTSRFPVGAPHVGYDGGR